MSGNSRRSALLLALGLGLAAAAAEPVAVLPPLSRSEDPARSFVDVPLAPADATSAAILVVFSDPVPADSVRAVTFHLRSGAGWLVAQLPPERVQGAVRIPLGAFSADEGSASRAAAADAVRVSLWRRAAASDTPPVAIASASFAPGVPVAVAGSGLLADRCDRLLDRIGVAHDRLPASRLTESDLASVRVLFLPDPAALGPVDKTRLRAFVRAGGRLVVFHSADPSLASLLGLAAGTWETSSGGWRGLSVAGSGHRIPHATDGRVCPRPGSAEQRTLATWIAADGTVTAAPAVVLVPRGAWFAHHPPRAFPAACGLVREILDALAPDLVPAATPAAEPAAPPATPEGFLLAAWSEPERVGDAPAALGALFVRGNAAWFRDRTGGEEKKGPALHAWLPCLLAKDGSWRDPTDPAVRKAVVKDAVRLVRAGATGVHLDYVRTAAGVPATPERTAAVTALVRDVSAAVRSERRDAVVSAAVFPTPSDGATLNQDWPAWIKDGLVDFVSPMIYDDDPAAFRARLDACLAAAPASSLLPGIGTGADESQTDAAAAAAELSACAAAGCRGAAFFPLDDALLELLPSLVSP